MIPNVLPSQLFPIKGQINPQSVAKNTAVNSGWVLIPAGSKWLKVSLYTGSCGGSVVTVTASQATSNGGANSKALGSTLITGSGTDNQFYQADLSIDQNVDINNGFKYVEVIATTDNVNAGPALLALEVSFGPNEFLG